MSNSDLNDFWLPRRNGERRSPRKAEPPFLTEDGLVIADLREGPRRTVETDAASEPLLPAEKSD